MRRVRSGAYIARTGGSTFRIERVTPAQWRMTQRRGGVVQFTTTAASKRELISFIPNLAAQTAHEVFAC